MGKLRTLIIDKIFSNQRNKTIINNILASFVVKGGALIVSILTIPAYMKYFDDEGLLGLWFTILSVLTWILTFDLGIGNGLRNRLVKALSDKDDILVKQYISSAYFIITLFAAILAAIIWIISSHISWTNVLHISPNVISEEKLLLAVRISFLGILIQFVLKIITSILYALQKAAIPNLLTLITSVSQLLFVLFFNSNNTENNLIILCVIHIICENIPLLIATFMVFFGKLKNSTPNVRFFKKKFAVDIFKLGGLFFWAQIMYMVITSTNEFFITRLTGPGDVVQYQVYNKLFTLLGSLFFLALTPLWSAITKAISEEDFIWVRKAYSKLNRMVALAVVFEFALVPLTQFIVDIWIGHNVITVNYIYSMIFALLGGIMIWVAFLSSFANGMGKLKIQNIFYTVGVVVKFVIIYFVGKYYSNWIIVVISNVIVLLIFCLVQTRWLNRYLKQMEGIGENV